MSDTVLTAKLFSAEMVIIAGIFVVSLAGVWFGLVGKVEASDETLKKVVAVQATQSTAIQSIKIDIVTLLERQNAAAELAIQSKAQQQQILEIVQEQVRRNAHK